ncbi:MAG: shikimate dehydrogenase [SAR202 cluster bacterium]|nr:shikimate dehydrogenase [SAR202 cluster bacterium]
MTRYIGLLGHPLSHSISPAFQQAALDHHGLPVTFEAWSTPPQRLGDALARLRREDCLGAGVTIPHKETVLRLVDESDPLARSIGAVNTIINQKGRLKGHNTDAIGLLRALKEKAGFVPKDKRVLLLGAGGAARAAAFSFVRENARSVIIANRNAVRAMNLADDLSHNGTFVTAVLTDRGSLAMHARNADLIVNATSMGMRGGGAEGESPLAAELITPNSLVFDMVYNPPMTPLLQAAKAMGTRTLGGLPMLIYQGAEGFELWTGKPAPIEVMFKAGEAALAAISARR